MILDPKSHTTPDIVYVPMNWPLQFWPKSYMTPDPINLSLRFWEAVLPIFVFNIQLWDTSNPHFACAEHRYYK